MHLKFLSQSFNPPLIFKLFCSIGKSISVYATVVLLILLGRAAFVFPLSAISNYMNRENNRKTSCITFRKQVGAIINHSIVLTKSRKAWLTLIIYVGNYMVGRAYERSSLDCFGIQTGLLHLCILLAHIKDSLEMFYVYILM